MKPGTIPRFMMDHMVIRLGNYLRIAGYDAEWDLGLRTHDLIRHANAAGRIFVTRNHHIREQFPPPTHMIRVDAVEPAVQFTDLVRHLRLDVLTRLFRMCIRCNTDLVAVSDKSAVRHMVHPNVYDRQERFFQCPACGTVFWHGSHVQNTCRKLNLPAPLSM